MLHIQGYDHLAVCLAVWFLYMVQTPCSSSDSSSSDSSSSDSSSVNSSSKCSSSHSHSNTCSTVCAGGLQPPAVQTQIFDLFDQEWMPIVVDLEEAFQQEQQVEGQGHVQAGEGWWRGNRMTMQHGDLRKSWGLSDGNVEEEEEVSLLQTDIFMCSFVLHENASFLVDEETGLLTGLVASVLQGAAVGASLVCTDSGNTLWPALKKTARLHGWEYWSDEENVQIGHKIMFGPKTFVILERVSDGGRIPSSKYLNILTPY